MPLTFLSPSFLTRFPLLTLPRTSRHLNQITMGKIPKQLQSSNSISTNTSVYKRRVIKQRETNPVHGQASQAEEEFESTAKVQRLRTISKKSRAGNSTLDSELSTVEQKKKRRKSVSADCQQTVEEESSVIVTKEVSTVEEMRNEPWTMLAHKKPQKDWVAYNPRSMRPPPLQDGTSVKLVSWNVNGLRAVQKLDTFSAFAQKEDFDILCLQETKLQEKNVEKIKESFLDGYENTYWTCSVSKLGYSGCAIISRIKPVSVKYGLGILDHDTEGRIVTVEFHSFYLICGYVPNSGDGLKRLDYRVTHWDPALADYMKELEKSKPVILTGDLNCAHQDIDIFSPATNRRSAGFTDEERESFEKNFLCRGFVDTFRRQHPGVVGYTYWGYRHGGRKLNKGWRLDYFLVSETIAGNIHDSYIIPDVTGSDHCPIGLILKV